MGAGRPSKYTPERVDKILQALRVGATHALACGYGGVDVETFNRWRRRYVEFADQVKEAEATAAVGWLAVIERASVTQWQAAAWKLERRYPHDYALQHRLTVADDRDTDGPDTGARERIASRLDELAVRRREREALEGTHGATSKEA